MIADAELTGRAWRATCEEMVERERDGLGGVGLGPYERDWLIQRRSPERVRHLLERARARPDIVGVNAPFAGPVGNPGGPPASFTPVGTTTSETNLWTPSIWTPIPALDMQTGKLYKMCGGGIFGTSSSAPTSVWTPRCGQSATPGTNITLGATTATTMIASLSSVPFYFEFTLLIRALNIAASLTTGTGNGFVTIGGITTAAGIIQAMGATIATTLDNVAATGLILSQTWNASNASNIVTCQWVAPVRSYN